jgi:outer membrane protein assembly factor BamB
MEFTDKIKTARTTAIVAGAFCLLIGLMLILNYWQMQGSEPLESAVLETLVQRLSLEPNNEQLKQEIREMDLLVRKAYFTSLWQVRTGGYLLLFAAIVLLITLRIYFSLMARIEKPVEEEENEISGRVLTRKWLLAGTGILIALALVAAFTVSDPLDKYFEAAIIPEEQGTIERVTLSDVTPEPSMAPDDADDGLTAGVVEEEGAAMTPEEPNASPAATAGRTAPVIFPDENTIRQNHNAFRGPWGAGVVYNANIPDQWDAESGRNILWKVPVPLHAFSSPIIWDDKLFLTGADEKVRKVFCFDRHTGTLLWEGIADNIPGSPASMPKTTDDTGLGAPSVTTDGIGVYAIFGTGDIIAFDMEGKRLWARNLGVPDNHYGHSSSLLSHNEKLFVQYDDSNRGRILCLNVLTGEAIWDITRESGISWASPLLAKIDNRFQLVVKGNPIVAGYDIETGKELWSVKAMGGEVGPSPAWGGGLVYAANEYSKMVAIDPATGSIVWEDNYYLPEVSSPVYGGGLLFISTTYALVACFDAKTSELMWEYDSDEIFYSSPIVAGGRVYVTDTGGTTYIFEIDRELKMVGKNSIGEEFHTIPAFADGRIYFRGEKNLYCIGR